MNISVKINGRTYQEDVEPRMLLVDFIREKAGLFGTKIGDDDGISGASIVLMNGKSVKSSLILAVQADGADITTIEGLAQNGELNQLQQAFWNQHAVQNGYSTPGLILSLTDLLQRNQDPSVDEIRKWLDGTLDRITGYENIVKAVLSVAKQMRGEKAEVEDISGTDISGAPLLTKEGPALIKGEARFIADISLPGMAHVAILRSKYAHAKIKSIDLSKAEKMPGVLKIYTAKDTHNVMPLPVVWVPQDIKSNFPPHPSGMVPGSQSVLAGEVVRYVGEQVAAVVAGTKQQAHDALDAILVDYEPLPVVTNAEEAVKEGAPQLHETVPNNLIANGTYGDKDKVDKSIAESDIVIEQRFHNQRMMAATIETRGALACYDDKTGDYTLHTNIQPLNPLRLLISLYVLGIPYTKLRVIAPNFGGSQGSKGYLYADAPLMLFIAKDLNRPVRWIEGRQESAASTAHGRDQIQYATLAGTKDGKINALKCVAYSNVGAYPVINAPGQPRTLIGRSIPGAYVIPQAYYEVNIVMTNTVQVGPLRGSGRSEAMFLIERLVDQYAKKIGKDPAEVRRLNMVPPDKFPYENGMGWTYDSGNYQVNLDMALEKAGYKDIAAKKQEARQRGKFLGAGIASYVAVAGVGRSQKMGQEGLVSGTWGAANIRVHANGEVEVTTGAQPHGQSQETTFAQIAAQELGIDTNYIRVLHSDTKGALYYSQASYGSRSLSVEGAAVQKAAKKLVEKIKNFAAYVFKAPLEAIVYEQGKVYATFAPDKAVMNLQQIAFTLWLGWDLPEGMDPGLEATAYFDPPNFNFPYGTHVAIVEVDEKTGQTEIVKYVAVDDFGKVINPKVVDGQTHGNISLGVGQALLEEVRYDENGQLITKDYSSYAIPRAKQLPSLETYRTETPSPSNPLGAKGAGDVSNPAVAPAIINAICDALEVEHVEMPARPEKLWKIISGKQ